MITVSLFHYGRQRVELTAATEKAADQAIDRLLTDVLADRHGYGEFHLDAEVMSDIGGTLRMHFMSGPFEHSAPKIKKPA